MSNASKEILLIDDDTLFVDVVAHKLQAEGFSCVYAATGTMGLDMLASGKRPDVILLDVTMPDMNGFGVLRKIKEDPKIADVPVYMFSNDATKENIELSKLLGAKQFIEKVQVVPGELAEILKRSLGMAVEECEA